MNACHCRQPGPEDGGCAPKSASLLRRCGEIAGWIIPGTTLILLPKCPVCVAAYVALFSGVGLSIAGASKLRTALLVLCVAALLCLTLKRLWRLRDYLKQLFARTKKDENNSPSDCGDIYGTNF